MSNYSYGPPPPPPPPPAGSGAPGATPWYRQPWPLFLLGLLVAAAVAIPVLLVVLGGEDGGTAASTSTTAAGLTSTTAGSTTITSSTTTTTPATTTSSSTTSSTAPSTTTTPASTTTTVPVGFELDYTLPAIYGEDVDLTGGFSPDPIQAAVEAGGPVDVSNLNEIGCWGWATVAPSYEVNWTAGASPLLRFYFVADNPGDDTVLVISDPYGNWICNDDYDFPADIYDPAVDFAPPDDGTYDIWVASYNQGEMIPGTLYVTEIEGNHP